eukprot:TRINITY_DN10544_c0_g1_i1.p1 TRINITY_DN10544_c0_g1~~TRINITY_DN10544_c0_g1_i1.p1  ORF type:complete len:384 (+),score=35.62 TRINITY_DN10544_c0_g1_i1:98-1153(+)
MASGGGHSIVVSESGNCSVFGWNSHQQLCLENEEGKDYIPFPKSIPSLDKIIKADAGWNFSFAVNDEGRAFGWGDNSFGQLSSLSEIVNKAQDKVVRAPTLVPDLIVSEVACGLRHTLVISGGRVFAASDSKFGQCGIHDLKSVRSFTQIEGLKNITAIACGWRHSLCCSDSGDVFAFGDGKYGQLGLQKADQSNASRESGAVRTPQIVDIGNVVKVFCGWNSSFALINSGTLLSFGRNHLGQLGLGHNKDTNNPTAVTFPSRTDHTKCIKFAAGSEHSVAVTSENRLFVWGWAEHGQLGLGKDDTKNRNAPTELELFKDLHVLDVSCGGGHTMVLTEPRKMSDLKKQVAH